MEESATSVAKSETISEYERHLDDAYSGLADRIQGQETQLTVKEFEAVTLAYFTEYYGEGTENHATFQNAYKSAEYVPVEELEVSDYTRNVVVQTEELLQATASYEEFSSGLQDLRAAVEADEVKPSMKATALKYLISVETGTEFLYEVREYVRPSEQTKLFGGDWWDNWGRCTAAIIGGAALGVLSGGAAGSSIPGVGTVAGGIIGGIGGGAAAAADHC